MKRHVEGIFLAISSLSLLAAGMVNKTYLLMLTCVWIVSSAIVIPLHFYKSWRRWPDVENKRQYGVWVGFETLAAIILLGLFIYSVSSR